MRSMGISIATLEWKCNPSLFSLKKTPTSKHLTVKIIGSSKVDDASRNRGGSVLAVDVGTGGTKAALISSRGEIMSSAFSPHAPPAPSPMGWQASMEQDQEGWWLAAKYAIKDCLSNHSLINSSKLLPDAIAVTGQMQDLIILPKNKESIQRQAILYSDARAFVEAAEIAELAGGCSSIVSATGKAQDGTSIIAKLRWIDKNDIRAAAECKSLLLGGHDYVVWKLCGMLVTDATTASTTGLTDLSFQYANSLLKRVNLGHWLQLLPRIAPVDIPCGKVSEAAATDLGFPSLKAVPVFHCCGDAGACSLGAGAGCPGSMYAYLGTSGWVGGSFWRSKESIQRNTPGVFTLAHPNSSVVFRTGSIMTAGGNLNWAASNLFDTSMNDTVPMQKVDDLAKLAQIGCGGLLYLPFLSGERCPFEDPTARAAFIGISNNTSIEEMFRSLQLVFKIGQLLRPTTFKSYLHLIAVNTFLKAAFDKNLVIMEGVSFALLSARDAMLDKPFEGTGPLRLVGGGASSPLWPQIIASVFGQTVEVLEDAQEVGVKGAALLAGKWLGWHDMLSPAGDWLKIQQIHYPCDKASSIYKDLFGSYKQAYYSLKPVFEKLSFYHK